MSEKKEIIRQEARRHRARIDAFAENLDAVAEQFFEKINPKNNQIVALYWAKGREFDPGGILEELLKKKVKCVLPVVQKESRILLFARWNESVKLEKGPFDVMQPVVDEHTEWLDPDILIIPMLAFDLRGNRLGYGGGYYDKTTRELRERKAIITVGVAYAQQAVLFNLPVEDHDQKLDWIITTQDARYFTG